MSIGKGVAAGARAVAGRDRRARAVSFIVSNKGLPHLRTSSQELPRLPRLG